MTNESRTFEDVSGAQHPIGQIPQAIARAAASDWITAECPGREVSWPLGLRIQRVFEAGTRRAFWLGDPMAEWDRTC